jgi:hypothetical protein
MTYVAIGRIGLVTVGFLVVSIRPTFAACTEGHCPPDDPGGLTCERDSTG